MGFKSSVTKESEAKIKAKKKENNEMKNNWDKFKNFCKTTLPWLVLFALAMFTAGHVIGHETGMQDQKAITQEVKVEAEKLAVELKTNE